MNETRWGNMDDPREILQAAGVECAEFDAWYDNEGHEWQGAEESAAILTLARLVAKYKWQRDEAIREWGEWGQSDHDQSGDGLAMPTGDELRGDLNRRWEDHNA